MHNKKSIASDYFYIIVIGIATVIILSAVFTIYLYFNEKRRLYVNLVQAATHIENSINESFDYSTQLATFVGSQIMEQGATSYKNIADILSGKLVTNKLAKNLFSYTIFDWITPDKKLVISGPYGILKYPKDVSFRHYAIMASQKPWKLNFDLPSYGIPSKQYILPAGMGITDPQGKFLGILSMGFNLSNLSATVKKNLRDVRIRFLILSQEGVPLFTSQETSTPYSKLPDKLHNIYLRKANSGQLPYQVTFNDVSYIYYKKFSKYPNIVLLGYDQDLLNKEMYTILVPRLVELLSIGSISIILLLIIRKRVVVPLIHLSNIAKQISNGNTKLTIPRFYSFEMNILAKQLENVISYTDELEQKVHERTRELEQALVTKTEFLNNMSHEIRTPIQGFTSISEGLVHHWQDFNDQRKLQLAIQVANNAQRLSSLLNHLLDLSKFNAGKMLLDLRQINIAKLIESSIEECKNLYLNNKQITFQFINESKKTIIYADQERLQQVLRNLLTNAIKFAPTNSTITIFVRDYDITSKDNNITKAIHFIIKDEGIAIPENELKSIFFPFTQSSRTKTKAGGTGLGLTICQGIIEAHHGNIWAENNQDKGTSIHFVIPCHYKQPTNQSQISYSDQTDNSSQITNGKSSQIILMIDDEEACLISMELLLHDSNYKLFSVSSGRAGIEYLKKHANSIDLILLDLMMPDMYGLNVLAEIKQSSLIKSIPVVLQTGIYDQHEIEKAYNLGAVGYIKKPYNKQVIIQELDKILLHKKYDGQK